MEICFAIATENKSRKKDTLSYAPAKKTKGLINSDPLEEFDPVFTNRKRELNAAIRKLKSTNTANVRRSSFFGAKKALDALHFLTSPSLYDKR